MCLGSKATRASGRSEGQGGQVSWTQAPVTRRRASWAGVIGFWQRAQGLLAERAVLASGPAGGRRAGGPGRSGRNRSPGDQPRQGRNDPGGPGLPARRSAPGVCAQPPLHGSACSEGLGKAQQAVGVVAAPIWVRRGRWAACHKWSSTKFGAALYLRANGGRSQ